MVKLFFMFVNKRTVLNENCVRVHVRWTKKSGNKVNSNRMPKSGSIRTQKKWRQQNVTSLSFLNLHFHFHSFECIAKQLKYVFRRIWPRAQWFVEDANLFTFEEDNRTLEDVAPISNTSRFTTVSCHGIQDIITNSKGKEYKEEH